MNKDNSLQILHANVLYANRDKAMKALNGKLYDNYLNVGEPAVLFYGEEESPKAIIAIGATNLTATGIIDKEVGEQEGTYFVIDTAKLEEEIAKLNVDVQAVADSVSDEHDRAVAKEEELKNAIDAEVARSTEADEKHTKDIRDLIEACGLIQRAGGYMFRANDDDSLIRNAEDITSAINTISAYAQSVAKASVVDVEDTKSVKLIMTEPRGEGKGHLLKANVLVSADGEDDEEDYNDNIIGIKSDGIFASVTLNYDAEKKQLIFTTSGMKNGRFNDEAKKKIIDLGKHTEIVPQNDGHNVTLAIAQGATNNREISADVKISQDENNILKVQDDKLMVDGRAQNIKYKGSNVFNALKGAEDDIESLKNDVQSINDTHFIEGVTTDTMNVNASKTQLGNFKVSGEVRLGSKQTIVLGNGGLEAAIDMEFDPVTNKIKFTKGSEVKEFTLNGFDIVDDIYYDSSRKELVVVTKQGRINVPIADLLKTWEVANTTNSPIVLTKTVYPDQATPDKLTAELRLASSDNLLSVDANGQLIAHESAITNAVAGEKARAEAAEGTINTRINSVESASQEADRELAGNIENNTHAIIDEAARAKAVEQDLTSKYEAVKLVADTNADDIDTLEETVGEFDNRIQAAEAKVETLEGKVTTAEGMIANTALAVQTEKERAIGKETELASDIALTNSKIAAVEVKADANTANIEKILGDENTPDSIRNVVKHTTAHLEEKIDDAKAYTDTKVGAHEAATTAAIGTAKTEAVETAKLYAEQKDAQVLAAAEGYADNKVAAHVTATDNAIATAKREAVDDAKAYADTKDTATLDSAKAYTDAEVDKHKVSTSNDIANAKREAIDTAKEYTNDEVEGVLADAKAYTDAETTRAEGAESALAGEVAALKQKDIELTAAVNGKVGHVEIVKNSMSDLQYILKVDGVDCGEVNIPKDQFLKSAEYNEASKEIVFTFVTTTGESTATIDVSNLVDTYLAGNGLNLADNTFSVHINTSSEAYLVCDEDGLKIVGIDAALATKANVGDSYTKAESDAKYLTEHQSLAEYAKKTEVQVVNDFVQEVSDKADANEEAIAIINGNEAQVGSVANAVKVSKDYADGLVSAEESRAIAVEAGFKTRLDIIEGNSAQEGSVEHAIATSKDYTEAAVLAEKDRAMGVEETLATKAEVDIVAADVDANTAAIAKLNDHADEVGSVKNAIKVSKEYTDTKVAAVEAAIATKANVGDSYTKAESDAKYLTEHQDLTVLQGKVTTLEANDGVQDTDIAKLKADVKKNALTIEETSSIRPTFNVTDEGSTLKNDVKLDTSAGNILSINGNGLYAKVSLTYNRATNTITFDNGAAEAQTIQLSDQSLLQSGRYDSATKAIVLTLALSDGGTREISIPITDLYNEWVVLPRVNSPVRLEKKIVPGQPDTLEAWLEVSSLADNAIVNNNGTLYASKSATKMYTTWNDGNTTIQHALDDLKRETDKVAGVQSDVTALQGRMLTAEGKIAADELAIEQFNTRVTEVKTGLDTVNGKMEIIVPQFETVKNSVQTMSQGFTDLTATVNSYDSRMTAVEASATAASATATAAESTVNAMQTSINNAVSQAQAANDNLEAYKISNNARVEALENGIDGGTF